MTAEIAQNPAAPSKALRRMTRHRVALIVSGTILLLAVVRIISGVESITSSGTIAAAIGSAVPIAMAGLGGLISERAGIINISLEGSMILGTFGAGWIGWQYGPWLGVVAAITMGALGAALHAIATVSFGVDQIISGVAVNILALGFTQYLATAFFEGTPGGGQTQSPPVSSMPRLSLPGADLLFGWLEDTDVFVVSDVAAMLRAVTVDVPVLTMVAAALIIATSIVLWRTALGLRLRMCGEDPYAADSLGVEVVKLKYAAVIASGALSGLGGAYLVLVASNIYREGQTAGRGFIGLGTVVFGNWMPSGMAAGAGLFGYIDAQQLRSQAGAHALILMLAVVVGIVTVLHLRRRRSVRSLWWLALGAGIFAWYALTDELPAQATFIAPYVATLIVLSAAADRFRPPRSTGVAFRKGAEP